jgi:hypothetical protein
MRRWHDEDQLVEEAQSKAFLARTQRVPPDHAEVELVPAWKDAITDGST